MTSAPKRAQPVLSQILTEGFPDAGTFEDIPKVRKIAGPATGPYASQTSAGNLADEFARRLNGKIAIVTGLQSRSQLR